MSVNADLHMHSVFSFDGKGRATSIARTAYERGAKAIAFTEHYDVMPAVYDDPMAEDNRKYYLANEKKAIETIQDLKEGYKGKMDIIYAVELGQSFLNMDESREFVNSRGFDFVLGSVHNTPAGRDYYHVDYDEFDVVGQLNQYFDDMLRLVKFGLLDSLAHLDYPVRVMENWLPAGAPMMQFKDKIAEILAATAAAKLPIELNTCGIHRWIGRIHPEPWVLKLFKDLGGTMVTTGSDAHQEKYALYGIDQAEALAESVGLKVVAGFRNHEPYFIN